MIYNFKLWMNGFARKCENTIEKGQETWEIGKAL